MASGQTKILVVDDDPFIREVLAAILEEEGYGLDTAEDGVEALEKFSADPAVGLIVSDMNMPRMGGLELIGKIRESGRGVPVILLTGASDTADGGAAIGGGASDYLLKDENIQDVISATVARVLGK